MPPRSIALRFNTSPAAAFSCGDGSGRFCKYYRYSLKGIGSCAIFGALIEKNGWVQRDPGCRIFKDQTPPERKDEIANADDCIRP